LRIKTLVAVASTAAFTAALAIGGAYAANASTIPAKDEAYIRANLTDHGVLGKTQDKLIAKYAAGAPFDSDTGAKPVSEKTTVVNDVRTTVYRYADGSYGVGKVEQAGDHTNAVTGCQVAWRKNDQIFWTGCRISWDAPTWSLSYVANYGIYQFGSWIDSAGGLTFGGAGTFSDAKIDIPVKEGHGRSTAAIARGLVTQCGAAVFCRSVGAEVQVRADWGGGRSSTTTTG
jgi:hypothetical protein